MKVTVELPDDWAGCLPEKEAELAEIVVAGLHRCQTRARHEIDHIADIVDTLADLPTPEAVLALRPSVALTERISFLLNKKHDEGLTPIEETEWSEIMRVEHLVRVVKANAAARLAAAPSGT